MATVVVDTVASPGLGDKRGTDDTALIRVTHIK